MPGRTPHQRAQRRAAIEQRAALAAAAPNQPRPPATALSLAEVGLARTAGGRPLWVPIPCTGCSTHEEVFAGLEIGRGFILQDGPRVTCSQCGGTGLGPQGEALLAPQFEIFLGGAKGGAKTDCGIAFLIAGDRNVLNLALSGVADPISMSYTNHPHYRGMVLRKNQRDLDAWIDRARMIYEPLGAEFVHGPAHFRFPSGAKIVTGHLGDADAYEKYSGVETHRMVIEEATQIPSLELYMRVRSCCRSSWPELKPQILLTGNPDGPGLAWVKDRFVQPTVAGSPVPPKTPVEEEYTHPFTGERHKISRVFIPAGLSDNPYLLRDESYVMNLMSLDDRLRRAYLDGDWSVMGGTYFDEFRRTPLAGEPQNARHVVATDSTPLAPWWPRLVGGDWGYTHESAFLWAAGSPDGAIDVYREKVFSRVSAVEVGVEIALATRDELNALPGRAVILYLSHDAFGPRTDERWIAELIGQGIGQVLGPDAVYLPDLKVRQLRLAVEADPAAMRIEEFDAASQSVYAHRRAGITIRRAPAARITGWQYCREALRWRSSTPPPGEIDWELALQVFRRGGLKPYEEYLRSFEAARRVEVLPRLRIRDCCPRLIDAIPRAVRDPENIEDVWKKHFTGMDLLDAWRYLMMGWRAESAIVRDEAAVRAEQLAALADVAERIQADRFLAAKAAENRPRPISIPRAARVLRSATRLAGSAGRWLM